MNRDLANLNLAMADQWRKNFNCGVSCNEKDRKMRLVQAAQPRKTIGDEKWRSNQASAWSWQLEMRSEERREINLVQLRENKKGERER